MRKLVVSSCIFLIISGMVLIYQEQFSWKQGASVVSILHLWTGMVFIVIFPIYAWDHIYGHRGRLKQLSWVSASGGIQLVSGLGLILSGIILMLYGGTVLPTPTLIHEILTFVLGPSLLIHSLIKK